MGPQGLQGHVGTDNSQPNDRCGRYVENAIVEETISYGQRAPMDVILHLAIDDNVPGRVNRLKIFNSEIKKFVCYTGPHSK